MNKNNLCFSQNNIIKLKKKRLFYKLQIFLKFYYYILLKDYFLSSNNKRNELFYNRNYYYFFTFLSNYFPLIVKNNKQVWYLRSNRLVTNYYSRFSYYYYISFSLQISKRLFFLLKKELFSIFLLSSRYRLEWVIKQINYRLQYWIKRWHTFIFFSELDISGFLNNISFWLFEKQCSYINKNFINKSTLWKIKYYFGPFDPYLVNFWVFGDRYSATYIIKY